MHRAGGWVGGWAGGSGRASGVGSGHLLVGACDSLIGPGCGKEVTSRWVWRGEEEEQCRKYTTRGYASALDCTWSVTVQCVLSTRPWLCMCVC